MGCYLINKKVKFDAELYSLEDLENPDSKKIKLSKMETSILEHLCTHTNDVVTRIDILKNIWPNDTGSDGHLNRLILLLRRKFESIGMLNIIDTVPKVGYIIKNVDVISTLPQPSRYLKRKFATSIIIITILVVIIAYSGNKNIKDHMAFKVHVVRNITIASNDNEISASNISDELLNSSRKDGRYYIGIFESALSVTYVNDEMTNAIRKIFIRQNSSLTEDLTSQLECVIKDVNDSTQILIHQTKEVHGTTQKNFVYEVNYGCPSTPKDKSTWDVSITYSNNSEQPYFLAITRLLNGKNILQYQTTHDGTIDTIEKNSRSNLKTSTSSVIYSGLNDDDIETPSFRLLSEYSKSGYTTELVKINKSIYYMSFMGGVILLIQ